MSRYNYFKLPYSIVIFNQPGGEKQKIDEGIDEEEGRK
jgi:hypothetical protein